MSLRSPTRDEIPAWYELDVKEKSEIPTLLIRIHKKAMEHIYESSLHKFDSVLRLQKKYGLQVFINPIEEHWGFGGVITQSTSPDPDWFIQEVELPIIYSGKKAKESPSNIHGLRTTLSLLFDALWLFEGETNCSLPQLMVIDDLIVHTTLGGAAINITLTPTFCQWIHTIPDQTRLTEVEEFMLNVDTYMWQNPEHTQNMVRSQFHVLCSKPKWINIKIPGDACGLDAHSAIQSDALTQGYTLNPHNIDNSVQQFTLLMGLAKLHDLARSSSP